MTPVPRLINTFTGNPARAALVAPEGATDNKGEGWNYGDFPTGMLEVAKILISHFSHLE